MLSSVNFKVCLAIWVTTTCPTLLCHTLTVPATIRRSPTDSVSIWPTSTQVNKTLLRLLNLCYDWPIDFSWFSSAADSYLQPSGVPIYSETHGGDDVAIFAIGPQAHLFQGVYEQHYIAHVMAYAACVGDGLKFCDGITDPTTEATNTDRTTTNLPSSSNRLRLLSCTLPVQLILVWLASRFLFWFCIQEWWHDQKKGTKLSLENTRKISQDSEILPSVVSNFSFHCDWAIPRGKIRIRLCYHFRFNFHLLCMWCVRSDSCCISKRLESSNSTRLRHARKILQQWPSGAESFCCVLIVKIIAKYGYDNNVGSRLLPYSSSNYFASSHAAKAFPPFSSRFPVAKILLRQVFKVQLLPDHAG